MINNLSLLLSRAPGTVQCGAVRCSEDKQTTNLPGRSAQLARAEKVSNPG